MPMAKNLVELRDVYKIYGEGRESEVRAWKLLLPNLFPSLPLY